MRVEDEEQQLTATEATSLLPHRPRRLSLRIDEEDDAPMFRHRSQLAAATLAGLVTCLAAAAVCLMAPKSVLGSSRLSWLVVVDHLDDRPSTLASFGEVAAGLLPSHYTMSLETIDEVFVDNVQPGDVAAARKVILKTRDLLDVFSPIYNDNLIWQETRNRLSIGYEIVGDFLDLKHCHIKYRESSMIARRNAILDWKASFAEFRKEHPNVNAYLASPDFSKQTAFRHHESHFFWKTVATDDLPIASTPAIPAIFQLIALQATQAQDYLSQTLDYESIIGDHNSREKMMQAQVTCHSLRKQLRAIGDEFQLFSGDSGLVMDPSMQAVADTITRARQILGDMNDYWTAYEFYAEHNRLESEQVRLKANVDAAFRRFQIWGVAVLEPALVSLRNQSAALSSSSSQVHIAH